MKAFILISCVIVILAYSPAASSQRCGQSFVRAAVFDKDDKPIRGTTIELLGQISDDDSNALRKSYNSADQDSETFRLPDKVALELVKQSKLTKLDRATDRCDNPVAKQTEGVTPTKDWPHSNPTKDKIGWCVWEGESYRWVLVKITGKSFGTAYFVTDDIRGCEKQVDFVIGPAR